MGGRVLRQEEGIGLSFGRLLVLGWGGKTARNHQLWLCVCRCGNFHRVEMDSLVSGKTKSCGCLKSEVLKYGSITHGVSNQRGVSDKGRTYEIWLGMRRRCQVPTAYGYKSYGGRGINVDPAWEDFSQFLSDMGTCPKGYSIERHDVHKGYNKDNCYWWPLKKQAMNKQDTIRIWYEGQEWCFKRLCEYLKKPYLKTYKRYVMRGWDLARALDIPEENKNDLARIK